MADVSGGLEQKHPNLHLSLEERRLFGQVFTAADSESLGVVTGDVALKFFPDKTKLPSEILGEIWQIADTEDKGFLTPAGFGIILRLIGYAQAGRPVSAELALKPGGPLPKFEGINAPPRPQAALQPQISGPPIRVPPLSPENARQYAALFEESGAQNGLLPGATAKQIFDRAQLPNDILIRIWNLTDTEQRGKLSITEFIIAMHLLASYRGGSMRTLPQSLPPGLYEAAARRGAPPRQISGARPVSSEAPIPAIPRPFSGAGQQRTSSPLARSPYGAAVVASQTAGDWGIPPHEKSQFDGYFAKLDPENRGYVTGDQAVAFFSNSRLPEEDLAQIWDLADINSAGQLSRDEFAVAMHLIGQQLSKKGPLPQTLPANLVPPSMRRQAQPPAPAFDVAAAFPKPKTAADDLFGLDAFTTDPQVPQSTGGSTSLTQGSPVTSASPAPQPSQQSSIFKPFAPISSFGQTIVTPQTTGLSASSRGAQQSRTPQSTSDDLLGDTDPEISKKLTQETSELANLSNQVGTLTTQMQQVKSKRASTEQDLSQVNTQKRDFESRLLRLRAAYEQEARDVKSLEVRLTGAKAETAKVQQDLAMVQHTHQGLLEQRQQVTLALDADITENAELKERIRQVNAEISQLKPRLEKMRSDARQQKGLVAINKKQLSTGEAERDKIKADLDAASKEYHDATNELEESKRALQSSSPNSGPVAVASPAPSNTSMNPFFRRTSTMPSERAASQPPLAPQSAATPNQNAFDSLFGPPFAAPSPFSPAATEAPLTAFGTNTSREMSQAAPGSSTASKGDGTPNSAGSSPRLVATKLPSAHDVPPPPPQSRQITSAFLPFEAHVSRSGSPNSSVGVAAPASRFGDLSGFATPTFDRQISQTLVSPPLDSAQDKSPGPSTSGQDQEGSTAGKSASRQPADVETSSAFHVFGQSSAAPAVPGAFPSDTTPFELPINASDHHEQQGPSTSQNDPFIISTEPRSAKDQFDSAFAGFDAKSETPQPSDKEFPSAAAAGPSPSVTKSEFPPIQEFGGEDSDSESERGFDDDFAGASPHQSAGNTAKGSNNTAGQTQELPTDPAPNRPEIDRGLTASSQLPTPNAQQPPPAYQRSTSHEEGEPRESNQFPKEWGGLLPSREGPLSSSAVQNPDALSPSSEGATASIFSTPTSKGNAVSGSSLPPSQVPMAPSATAATSASDNKKAEEMQQPATATTTIQPQQPPAIQPKNVFDDFDHEFDDLTEARPVEDTGDDDFGLGASSLRDGLDAFNPTFDSPVPSRGTTSSLMQNSSHNGASSFHDFETSVAHPTASASNTTHQQQQSAVRVQSPTDWDAIFAGLGSDAPAQTNGNGSAVVPGKDVFGADAFGEGPLQPVPAAATKPALARALTTEHDDPILKRLTGMGYPREESLRALEKFDYNLDKAADYLTSNA